MSGLLLDTHVWLWYVEGIVDRLSPEAVRRLDAARRAEGLKVLSVSAWEIGLQVIKGRIQLFAPLPDWVELAADRSGAELVPLDAAIAIESVLLPDGIHGDPADRFLIAAARKRGYVLATRDERILEYGNAGHVRVLAV